MVTMLFLFRHRKLILFIKLGLLGSSNKMDGHSSLALGCRWKLVIRLFPSGLQMCFSQSDRGYQVRSVYIYMYLKANQNLRIRSHLSSSLIIQVPSWASGYDSNDSATFVVFDREMTKLTKKDAPTLALEEVRLCSFTPFLLCLVIILMLPLKAS